MREITIEWVQKAEGDYETMEREARARKRPNYDAVCFHAQQCAEKYLKARLSESAIKFPKTHDLVTLLDLVLPVEPLWASFRTDFARLSEYAVNYRYPGDFADKETAANARKMLKTFRLSARQSLRLRK